MSSLALSRLSRLQFAATTNFNKVSANGIKDISMKNVDDHHHDDHHMATPSKPTPRTSVSLGRLLANANQRATVSFNSVRLAHTDIKVPNFDDYRNSYSADPRRPASETAAERQAVSYLTTFGSGLIVAYGAKAIVRDIVASIAPSADVLAMAKIEVNLAEIPEGKNVVFKWRSKPLFIKHRTAEQIEAERSVNLSELRDPQADELRTKKPEWLVLLGICTHLGCVPIANSGDFNGYFCPCHGSHYDGSGRIRKGPAPLNLEIPPHEFNGDILVVG